MTERIRKEIKRQEIEYMNDLLGGGQGASFHNTLRTLYGLLDETFSYQQMWENYRKGVYNSI